jgi:outer membrane protein TolC
VLLHVAGAAAQKPATLDGLYSAVRARNPRLQASIALVQARSALESGAGLPPDPQVEIGAMKLALPGLTSDMPSSMLPSIQVMQMLPLFGKLRLTRQIARNSTTIARAEAEETWWEVRGEAAMAFL